ncbi:MAG: excinuclease ABC subunit UvrB [Tissierellia bacterium]|mgnify:FL=1|nr:excinuclease ABC subunit UvrB [Bacillota bacterium]NLL23597.1 excinuclease ABC subunit UvrB [Tissierellia bacterium]
MSRFVVKSSFSPMGDQPEAIESLSEGVKKGLKYQTLLGVTGSGKTYTMAKVVEKVNKPTLVLAHNKTLAAQLASEFREFFPNNAVEFFVSYYDYYQPEAYVPGLDLYIEKDSAINDEIDKLRHSATAALQERSDVLIVASVSCIYGLGSPVDYRDLVISLRPGQIRSLDSIITRLVDIQYRRNDYDFKRGTFRVRGDAIEIIPAGKEENAIRVEFFGDEIDRISEVRVLTGEWIGDRDHIAIFPASHFVSNQENILRSIRDIEEELQERLAYFRERGKLLEAQRLEERTRYDMEMLREMGFTSGIENYSRILLNKKPGERPFTLIDYFPDDFLLMVDESHVSLPQVRGMYAGDRSRKLNLVEYGFRLPSALDNRPLRFDEFIDLVPQMVFVSATPGPYEVEHEENRAEQILRPTGLLDPLIEVRPIEGQMEDLYSEIMKRAKKNERVLVTTLTKRMAEDLTDFLKGLDVKVTYMHSDVETLERMEIIRDLRLGEYDVLVGINLLREGLDLPEVSLVAILDADKEGFLRSETSLVQTIGRAARHAEGKVVMYADNVTGSMQRAIDETKRRRTIQDEYNKVHGITPKSIVKEVREVLAAIHKEEAPLGFKEQMSAQEKAERIAALEVEMFKAANALDYEKAIDYRNAIEELKRKKN